MGGPEGALYSSFAIFNKLLALALTKEANCRNKPMMMSEIDDAAVLADESRQPSFFAG